jgi:MarR family transcriptional regulator, lower aerobic nicotinate degradation pathway regulator
MTPTTSRPRTEMTRATHRPGDASPFALGLILRRAHDRAASSLAQALKPVGLELRHFAVMITLSDNGAMSQRQLADALDNDKASMVRIIDDLERKGYARREAVPGDRRVHSIVLTPEGLDAFDAAHRAADSIRDQLVAHLRNGEPEQLLDLLTRFTYPDL